MSRERPFWRARLLPLVLALLGLNLVAFAGWTAPRLWRQRNAAARAEAAQAEVQRQRETAGLLRARADAIRSNTVDLARFYRNLAGPEKEDLLPSLEAIEALARSPGLQTGARSYRREEVQGAPLERVSVTLPLQGTYRQLVAFLREVESSPRFLTVDRVALRADSGGEALLQVELSTYLRPSAEAGKEGRRGRS